jgi:hypothetical protein
LLFLNAILLFFVDHIAFSGCHIALSGCHIVFISRSYCFSWYCQPDDNHSNFHFLDFCYEK